MKPFKTKLLCGTVIPAAMLAAGILTASNMMSADAAEPGSVAANPCAVRNPCAARNPCAPRNPCAAANPCSPCGPRAASAGQGAECNIPRPQLAATRNPCNPCAAKRACNPCAARNPCNPCAAANPCNPCAPGAEVELTGAEAKTAYDCLSKEMRAGYRKSGNQLAGAYARWAVYNDRPYVSVTHGGRFVNNFANAKAKSYGRYEKAGKMPPGAVLAKDSFRVRPDGNTAAGPLFLMEKMPAGFSKASGDWRYTLIMASGRTFGVTEGPGSANVRFCAECHFNVAEEQDSMFFLPEEYRRN